jgi:GMP synthase (glutamine-hydrolysing)
LLDFSGFSMEDVKMNRFLILKAGSTFPETRKDHGDFDDWIIHFGGLRREDVTVVESFRNEEPAPDPCFSGVFLTGSHAMVTDEEPWMGELLKYIPRIIENQTPFLGICFGHQLLAKAMGGEAGHHPEGIEIGSVEVSLTEEGRCDRLFGVMPNRFQAHVTHRQTALRLPENATLLAYNDFEPHHAFRLGQWAWGVQFHPEFSAPVMESYIHEQESYLVRKNYTLEALKSAVSITTEANSIMKRFVDLAKNKTHKEDS